MFLVTEDVFGLSSDRFCYLYCSGRNKGEEREPIPHHRFHRWRARPLDTALRCNLVSWLPNDHWKYMNSHNKKTNYELIDVDEIINGTK